ncbi:DeoR/GlpR family transcriptional regulator [Thorsellia kenyensis]|uniref:DeoR/GlpR family transcriptional regulator n=1 Tax=Thorsellia kenyensis TaxID=1549888 RepID=A0ABV6CFM5_9GAMM
MKQSNRHKGILALVQQNNYVSTDELVAHFNVSAQTIRRDLNELAEQNKILRHHGGAALPSSSVNSAYVDRKDMWSNEKAKIATRAAKLIPNGSSLFIDVGTTPEAVALALTHHSELKIVTNNINVAHLFSGREDIQLIIAGGEVRTRDGAIVGEATIEFINQFHLDFGVLGISGIDSSGTLLEFDHHEARTKKAIIENSRQTILVSDHSKFGRPAIAKVGDAKQINYIVTNQFPDEEYIQMFKTKDVELIVC